MADADPVAVVYGVPAHPSVPLAVVALEPTVEGLRTAAARAVRASRRGGTVAWILDKSLPLATAEQVRALAEGAVIGGYDGRRWRSGEPPPAVERFVICGCNEALAPVADRAALVARWTNTARELVDAPANVISPAGLAERAAKFDHLVSETVDPVRAGLGALAAVGGSSPIPPRLIVLRHAPPRALDTPRLALIGKAVTFDTGGYFLKPQSDIVRQKADMAGGAAVVAALGAIAELGLPLSVTGFVPACENMLSGTAIRPTDVITTAAGLTVEVTNPDAEGRLILADALWYARRDGATHIVDLATLTGAMRAGMGDLYAGVFAPDESWRDAVVRGRQRERRPRVAVAASPALPDADRLDRRRPAQQRRQELRLSDRGRDLPSAVRGRRAVGACRHARPGAARRRSRRRVRSRRVRLRRPHARRARHAPERRGRHVSRRARVTLAR